MSYRCETIKDVTVIKFPLLEKIGVMHGFSTKEGGVSEGCYQSLNLSFSRGDKPEDVLTNHKRFASAIGYDIESLVFSDQIHKTEIRTVERDDCGKGILRPRDYEGVDGLITSDEEVTLITFYADCIPLFFADPVKKVVAMAHSGWRGTVAKIGKKMIERMQSEFGCRVENIYAQIGPGICQDCYEVSEDVYRAFQAEFSVEQCQVIFIDKKNGKYQLDLWKANEIILKEAGLSSSNYDISGLCTCCHSDFLYSHRKMGDKRGNLAGVISCKGMKG